jgi:hypothetical protein
MLHKLLVECYTMCPRLWGNLIVSRRVAEGAEIKLSPGFSSWCFSALSALSARKNRAGGGAPAVIKLLFSLFIFEHKIIVERIV